MTELFGRDKPGGDVEVDDGQGEGRGREVKVTRVCPLPLQTAFSSPATKAHSSTCPTAPLPFLSGCRLFLPLLLKCMSDAQLYSRNF